MTLTGPGGTGKTRLSLRIAEESAHDFGDGTYFVQLAPISDPELVPSTIAHTLGVQVSGGEMPLSRLRDHIRDKRMLLVLDNFEQILPAAPVVGELLGASAALKVIASSRAPLRIAGEQEYPVPPLEVPDPKHLPTLETLAQSDAVRLFIERAMAVRPGFRVTPENAAAVAEICNRLDGLPLAIELAAARVKVLTPEAMLPRLRQGLDVLASTARDLPERQRTLRGAIGWSFDLLDASERRLFARLAVFVAGTTLAQIEAICGPAEEVGRDLLDVLSALVEHSLVHQSEAEGEPRFRLLVTIREYALERLAQSGERDEMRRRHALGYLALAEEARPHLQEKDQKRWLDLLERDHDNLRAAIEWSITERRAEEGCRLVFAIWRFWQVRGHLVEGAQWCERVLALPTDAVPPLILMRALEAAGGIAYWRGLFTAAVDYYSKALELANAHGDAAAQATATYNLAFGYGLPMSNVPRAIELLRIAQAKWDAAGDQIGSARAAWAYGSFMQVGPAEKTPRPQLEEALVSARKALAVYRTAANRFDLAWAFHLTGLIQAKLGEFAGADADFREAAQLFREDRDISGLALMASDYGALALAKGQHERRATLVGVADVFARRSGSGLVGNFAKVEGRWLPADVPADLRPALERGLAMDEEDAFAYLIGGI